MGRKAARPVLRPPPRAHATPLLLRTAAGVLSPPPGYEAGNHAGDAPLPLTTRSPLTAALSGAQKAGESRDTAAHCSDSDDDDSCDDTDSDSDADAEFYRQLMANKFAMHSKHHVVATPTVVDSCGPW